MSDEEKKVDVKSTESEEQTEQNIDNQEQKKEERTVPLRVHIEERKKLQAKIAEAEEDAEIARSLSKVSGKDRATLRKEIELAQQKKQTQPQPQQTSQPNDEIRKLREEFANDRRERELDKFAESNIVDIDSDMREDILDYSKAHDISVREATFARYGDTIIDGMKKTSEKKAKKETADMAMVSNSSMGDPFTTRTEVPLSPAELQAAEKAGMSPSEWAAYASDDPSVLRDYINKQKKKE